MSDRWNWTAKCSAVVFRYGRDVDVRPGVEEIVDDVSSIVERREHEGLAHDLDRIVGRRRAGRPTHVGPVGTARPRVGLQRPVGRDPAPNLRQQPGGRSQPQRGPVQPVCDQHVGCLGGTVHGGGLQRRDPGVGPGRGVRSSDQKLRAEIGQVPGAGKVQGPIHISARIDEHVDQLGRWRPPFRLWYQLEHRVVANPQVDRPRVSFQSRSQPIDVTDQERMQSRLDPLIITIAHQRQFIHRCNDSTPRRLWYQQPRA